MRQGVPRVRDGQLCAALLCLAVVLAACGVASRSPVSQQVPGGDSSRGEAAMLRYGCGSCHAIPGVSGANGNVGPPLSGMGERRTVAGMLANEPANLIHWIQDPQSVVPGNAMPNMGVTDDDARDIATYLYTLK